MAVTAREQMILDRFDGGMPIERIAAELGLSKTYVANRLSQLSGADPSHRMHCAAMALANVAFVKAIIAARAAV